LINIHILLFDKYFYKNKEPKLGFGDRVVVLNNFLYGYVEGVFHNENSKLYMVWTLIDLLTISLSLVKKSSTLAMEFFLHTVSIKKRL
jgi:hypothetical protein